MGSSPGGRPGAGRRDRHHVQIRRRLHITRTSSGQTYTTSQFGSGTITRDSKGNTWTASKFGDGAITRGPDGQTVTTSKFGSGYISRDNSGSTTTTSKFGDGTIIRGATVAVQQQPLLSAAATSRAAARPRPLRAAQRLAP